MELELSVLTMSLHHLRRDGRKKLSGRLLLQISPIFIEKGRWNRNGGGEGGSRTNNDTYLHTFDLLGFGQVRKKSGGRGSGVASHLSPSPENGGRSQLQTVPDLRRSGLW